MLQTVFRPNDRIGMEYLALAIAAVGHAFWDNALVWMVKIDPDASILHLHWLRMLFMTVCLFAGSLRQKTPEKQPLWWLKFSFVGWVIPSIMYTLSVLWEGYRISVSFQTFIPLVVIFRTKTQLTEWKCFSITLAMCGTLVIWSSVSWKSELWAVWASIGASIAHVFASAEFFVMLYSVKKNKFRAVTIGAIGGQGILFMLMALFVHPSYLFITAAKSMKTWLAVLCACAVTAGVKFWLMARFSSIMKPDGLAIFECIHPIATLTSDILWERDYLAPQDSIAILFFLFGWFLYPKNEYIGPSLQDQNV